MRAVPATIPVLLTFLASLTATPLGAQRLSTWPETWNPTSHVITASPAAPEPGTGLVLGGVAGFFSTALLSRMASELAGGDRICGDDPCGMAAGFSTFFVAEPFLIPAGVHLANRRKGSYATAAAVSSAIWFGGLMLGSKAQVPGEYILMLPVAQVAASVIIITRTTPRSP